MSDNMAALVLAADVLPEKEKLARRQGQSRANRLAEYFEPLDSALRSRLEGLPVETELLPMSGSWILRGPRDVIDALISDGRLTDLSVHVVEDAPWFAMSAPPEVPKVSTVHFESSVVPGEVPADHSNAVEQRSARSRTNTRPTTRRFGESRTG